MKVHTSAIAFMSVIALCCGCAVMGHLTISEETYLGSESVDQYDTEVHAGFAALNNGNYHEAAIRFRAALAIPIDEAPNYEPMIPLAIAVCKMGNEEEGRALLHNASCMLDVESKTIECAPAESISNFLQQGGTDLCYRMMCGEMYLPYYESPTDDQMQHIATLKQDLRAANASCETK